MNHRSLKYAAALATVLTVASSPVWAQSAPAPVVDETATAEETITLTPFEVTSDKDVGYSASTTLAGNRLSTELRDVGSAISVVTEQFMKDIGATDNNTLLQYTTATEVGSIQGNFTGTGNGQKQDEGSTFVSSNTNTRVRGLAAADNTRDFFGSDIPWDGYNVDRVDMQRGPNSILFGQGSPAGIINTSTKGAAFKNTGETEVRVGENGTYRGTVNINRELFKKELAFRVAALTEKENFKQKPAFEEDHRIYGAIRFEPRILNKENISTIIKINGEKGHIDSNRPRAITPVDYITPWFQTGKTYVDANGNIVSGPGAGVKEYNNLNRQLFDPYIVQDNNSQIAGHGQVQPTINATGAANPAYIPWLGNFAQNYGGPLAVFNSDSSDLLRIWMPEIRQTLGKSSTGATDGSIQGIPYQRQVAINEYWRVMQSMNVKNSKYGVYKNAHLTDSSIFDFYHKLIDGPTKHEFADFRAANLSIAQTYFKNTIGWEFAYDNQKSRNGQFSLLSDTRQGIYIDMMATLADGSVNPNAGRPFISDGIMYGNNSNETDRESRRFTSFYTFDFNDLKHKSWLTKLLGRHTFTGLAAEDVYMSDRRSFMRYRVSDAFAAWTGVANLTENANNINPIIYLGESLIGRDSAAGANIDNPGHKLDIMSGNSVYAFDSNWKATGVSPGAAWTTTDYWGKPITTPATGYTQSENPANYVGWTNVPLSYISAEEGHQDEMTTNATLTKKMTSSRGVVWQGQFWNKFLVGNYGVRNDIAKAWVRAADKNATTGLVDVSEGSYNLSGTKTSYNRVQENSRSWSVVAHLNRVLPDVVPVNISLFYNESENFQPEASRYDIYGQAMPLPQGRTWDRGFVISTKDEKYSLRVNKYETRALNATISGGLNGSWFIGGLEAWGANWADTFEHNLNVTGSMASANQGSSGKWTYGPATGETTAQAAAREASVISAWRAHQARVPKAFYDAYQLDITKVQNHNAVFKYGSGPSFTEDAVSKGYEFEFTANPTKNWRISFNAAKTKASRTNIGGAAFNEFINIVEEDLAGGAAGTAGDLRIWWGGAGNTTTYKEWNYWVGSAVALMKMQEGLATPEIREWRYNVISNYSFRNGRLKGLNVGGGLRWQDEILIGYPVLDPVNNKVNFDLANPYMGPSETNIDAWVSYNRRLTKAIDWTIQLNVRNLTAGNDLIPISTQPDGTPAAYRIAPPRVITLTNTFRF